MFKVITMVNKKIVSKAFFDETVDEEAMKKALVECDRALINQGVDDKDSFLVALMQDNRLLRFMNDSGWYMPHTSIYE